MNIHDVTQSRGGGAPYLVMLTCQNKTQIFIIVPLPGYCIPQVLCIAIPWMFVIYTLVSVLH